MSPSPTVQQQDHQDCCNGGRPGSSITRRQQRHQQGRVPRTTTDMIFPAATDPSGVSNPRLTGLLPSSARFSAQELRHPTNSTTMRSDDFDYRHHHPRPEEDHHNITTCFFSSAGVVQRHESDEEKKHFERERMLDIIDQALALVDSNDMAIFDDDEF